MLRLPYVLRQLLRCIGPHDSRRRHGMIKVSVIQISEVVVGQ